MTKLYRVVSYVLGLNDGYPNVTSLVQTIQGNRHPEFHYIAEVRETNIGEWHDQHELNYKDAPYEKYFPELNQPESQLIKVFKETRVLYLQAIDREQAALREARRLREEIAKLKKVQEFVKTIGDLID